MKKSTSTSELIFHKMVKGEPFKADLSQAISDGEFVSSGMSEVWAGLLRFDDKQTFEWLIKQEVYPNDKSEIVHQILFNYDCFKKRREDLEKKMQFAITILEKTPEGQQSIVKDIEKYFQYYGKVFVKPEIYPFVESAYKPYTQDKNKIHYLQIVNQLKFFNTFSKPINQLSVIEDYTIPVLDKIVNTSYFNKVKKIKFTNNENQQWWDDFCNKYKAKTNMETKLPPTGKTIKKIKI